MNLYILFFGIIIIFLKIIIINYNYGFEACYKIISPLEHKVNDCDRSWNNIWKSNYTRYDEFINFGINKTKINQNVVESNWNLSALNSNKYSYYNEDQPNPFKLGLNVIWKFNLQQNQILIRYIGKIKIEQDDIPPLIYESYDKLTTQKIYLENLENQVKLTYEWDSNFNQEYYAAIQVLDLDGKLYRNISSFEIKVLVYLLNFLTLLSLFLIIYSLFNKEKLNFNTIILTILPYLMLSILFFISIELIVYKGLLYFKIVSIIYFMILLLINIMRHTLFDFIYSYMSIFLFSLLSNKFFGHGNESKVIYRERGSDFLTYFSFAREILNTGSLQGGENIFVYSPLIRYLLVILHFFLGDSDNFIFLIYIFVLFLSAHIFILKSFNYTFTSLYINKFQIIFFILTLLLYSFLLSNPVFFAGYISWSEYPTWILLIILFTLLLNNENSKYTVYLFSFLCGLILMFRANQLVGILILLFYFVLKNKIIESLNLMRLVISFFLGSSIALIHNLYYGNSLIFLQTSLPLPVNFPLKVSDLRYIFNNEDIRQIFLSQITGLIASSEDLTQNKYFTLFLMMVRIAQMLYILLIFWLVMFGFSSNLKIWILLLIPLGFLIPHIFIQIFVYHPRHIIVGYLSIYLITFHLLYLTKKSSSLNKT